VIVAFVGPSLTDARAARGCELRPPARQGDVWRALDDGASVIALVDGVFESQPSVWHREILDALAEGVPVLGGASMGALRAAELHALGMAGVGRIFGWYSDGTIIDDAEVALLHADAEHGFRPLTVPQVNVRWSAAEAVRRGSLPAAAARRLVEASARIFYQDRTPARLSRLLPAGFRLLDLKARDAAAVLAAARRASYAPPYGLRPSPAKPAPPPALRGRRMPSSISLRSRLPRLPYDPVLADAGLRRALLAGQARELGWRATPKELAAAEERWRRALDARSRQELLARTGLRDAEVERLREELALERLVLDHAPRMLSDGPWPDEALADELRLRGYFREPDTSARRPRRPRSPRA
jgi:hypothetical protein